MVYSTVTSLDSLILPSIGCWGKLSHLPTISLHVQLDKTALCQKYHYFYTLTHITAQGIMSDTKQRKYKPITICHHLLHFKLSWKHVWMPSCTITMKLQHEALLSEGISRSRCCFSVAPASPQKRRKLFHHMLTSLSVLTVPVPFSRHETLVPYADAAVPPTLKPTVQAASEVSEGEESILHMNLSHGNITSALFFPSSNSGVWGYILSALK